MDDENVQSQDGNAEDVIEKVVNAESEPTEGSENTESLAKSEDPLSIKKRLGQQAKKHARETRELREQIAAMQSRIGQPSQPNQTMSSANDGVDDHISRAVRAALEAKEAEKRHAEEAEKMAHVHRQYQSLNDEFDRASEKYEDFDDVVRGDNVPFTSAMRDALLLIDNPSDVAYKLGKNRDELSRISKLHPLDQAREINKLSFALMGGKPSSAQRDSSQNKLLEKAKTNPSINSSAYTVDAIRARMKDGTWK